jgi:hypothetical protein
MAYALPEAERAGAAAVTLHLGRLTPSQACTTIID